MGNTEIARPVKYGEYLIHRLLIKTSEMSYIPSRGYRDNWRTEDSEVGNQEVDLDMMVTTRIHR